MSVSMDDINQKSRRGDPMIVALIHWRIKPDEASIAEFLKFWREQATVGDRAGLVGEFLSEAAKLTD